MVPVSFNDPVDLKDKVEKYFARCENSKKIYDLKNGDVKIRQEFPTMSGLAVYLGVTRETLYSYMNGESKTGVSEDALKEISDTLSYARQRIATQLAQASLSGDADSKIASMLLNAMGEVNPEVSTTVNVFMHGDVEAYSM